MNLNELTIYRSKIKGRGIDGRSVRPSQLDIETFKLKGSLRPYKKGKHRIEAPEGFSTADMKMLYTQESTLLRTSDEFTEEIADYVILQGREYIVKGILDYSETLIVSNHYRYLLVARDLDRGRGL